MWIWVGLKISIARHSQLKNYIYIIQPKLTYPLEKRQVTTKIFAIPPLPNKENNKGIAEAAAPRKQRKMK